MSASITPPNNIGVAAGKLVMLGQARRETGTLQNWPLTVPHCVYYDFFPDALSYLISISQPLAVNIAVELVLATHSIYPAE
jgi:hypothetical protein